MILRNGIKNAIVSSVKGYPIPGSARLKRYLNQYIELDPYTPLPIKNSYRTPDSLGKDRLAAVIGGNSIFPGSNILIIDAGTAITYDFIKADGTYIGGNISPGLKMRFQALHQYTNQLPLLKREANFELLGRDTHEAIVSGVQNGIVFELNQYIAALSNQNQNLHIILTGGDSKFFDNKLKYPIFVEPNLVLLGLNKILKYNIYAS
jgi:type III pantothenate kinase